MSSTPPEYGPPSEYGPPPGYSPPSPPQYGQPPAQQYGPPPAYGQQYGPPPGQQYGPPPGYGQSPAMGPVTTQFARIDPGPSQAFGGVSAVVSVVGGILLVVAFTAVNWFKGPGESHVSEIHTILNSLGSAAESPAKAYFSWLGWTLLIVGTITALLSAVPTVGRAFRAIAPVVAVAGVVATFLAIRLLSSSGLADSGVLYGRTDSSSDAANLGLSYTDYLKDARLGFYLAVAGFLLVGIGALIGPRNRRG